MKNVPHLLFICGMNRHRSLTAEQIYKHDSRCEVRSAGVSPQAEHTVSRKDLEWAGIVICMEQKHKDRLKSLFSDIRLPKIVVLDIGDEYRYMDSELVKLLKEHVELLLG